MSHPLALRLKATIEAIGDEFTIASVTHRGVFGIISPARAAHFLSQVIVDGMSRPIRTVYVPFDDGALVGDTLAWDVHTLTVKKILNARFRNETVAKVLIVS